jgi:AmmeMemoRadiSam system protein A
MTTLGPADRRRLLELARESVVARVRGLAPPRAEACGRLAEPRAAFVTLRLDGRLRGCIGSIDDGHPLGEVVVHCAGAAAVEDPRFAPVSADEVARLVLEISVLTPAVLVGDIEEVEVGRHGLIVELGRSRGLLLPQVALEWRWDRETFVAQTCLKAGLAPDAWRRGGSLYRFEAEVFGDVDS